MIPEDAEIKEKEEGITDETTEAETVFEEKSFKEDNLSLEERNDLAEKIRKSRIRSFILDVCIYAVILFVCIRVVPEYVIQRTIVTGKSMENTLHEGENLLVEKLTYHFSDPKRFDIVVFYPYGKEIEEHYVKRVIGLPGETVQIIGENIFINGEILEEHYGKDPIVNPGLAENPIILAEDEYFLLGDNRTVSLDSRYEEVGPVHRDLISGQAVLRVWPIKKFGTIE